MPRPNISVPKPNQNVNETVSVNSKTSYNIFLLSVIILALIVGSMNPAAAIVACIAVIITLFVSLTRMKTDET